MISEDLKAVWRPLHHRRLQNQVTVEIPLRAGNIATAVELL